VSRVTKADALRRLEVTTHHISDDFECDVAAANQHLEAILSQSIRATLNDTLRP
jgi:hypothetical protein